MWFTASARFDQVVFKISFPRDDVVHYRLLAINGYLNSSKLSKEIKANELKKL